MGWFHPFAIGLVFTWVGGFILFVCVFVAFGGLISKADDLRAFSISGAGKMDNHLKNIQESSPSRLVFLTFGLVNGFIPVLIGYLLQKYG